MNPEDRSHTIVVEDTADSLDELSDYLDVLSSSARLRILKSLAHGPRDARTISHEIETSYENTKKHLDRLLLIGLIKKEAGLSATTSKGTQPVWQYSIVRGGLEAIIRNLGVFSNTQVQIVDGEISRRLKSVKKTLSKEVLGGVSAAIVMGGADDGKIFFLKDEIVLIGRIDRQNPTGANTEKDVILSGSYTAVTRISNPHGRFIHELDRWYIEDSGSAGGTRLNNQKLERQDRTPVNDGDIIELGKGVTGVKLLMLIPKNP